MNIYDFSVKNVKNEMVSLKKYEGKALLIINSATKCGLTPQYDGIEKLYKAYQDQGFEVLDFPCNQFMNQAPGSNEELKAFCELNFGTTFGTFAKIDVNGKQADPLFKYLKDTIKNDMVDHDKKSLLSKVLNTSSIKWNFTKFLVDKQGNVVYRFAPSFLPENIEPYLKEVL